MKIGFLGNGKLAHVLGAALQQAAYEVRLGTRENLADVAAFGDVLVLAINPWTEIEGVLRGLPRAALDGKVIVDASNDIDFAAGPVLSTPERSMGQRIQAWVPEARVVKTLNFIPAELMVQPTRQRIAPAIMWVAGNDPDAKGVVAALLNDLGWSEVVDLGGIERSRFQEATGLLVSRVVSDLVRANR